ncbi:hypothetical protein BGZ93_001334 [Podila epicladia]|nr:hypothetical protein BGZ93_001334 [Podila epicladia]
MFASDLKSMDQLQGLVIAGANMILTRCNTGLKPGCVVRYLTLDHLGFVLEHHEDVEHIAQVVREGGLEMQKLGSVRSPSDKMNVILSCHRVVVDALNREPAVQEMLAGAESFKSEEASDNTPSAAETDASQSQHGPSAKDASSLSTSKSSRKRLSMPRIPMDGVIPRLDPNLAAVHMHAPRIPMDEIYERPSMSIDESATNAEEPTEDKDIKVESKEQNVKVNEHTFDENATNNSSEPRRAVIDIKPSEVPLPDSPMIDTASETYAVPLSLDVSISARKQYSADVLIPLLIFSVVKSNPPMLISNLSDTSDIRLYQEKTPPTPLINLQDGLDQTKALGHKVGQEIVGVAEEGLKVISDVVQDGYSKFLGRFLTSTDNSNSQGNQSRANGQVSASSSLAATAVAASAAAARLSMEDTKTGQTAGLATPAVLTSNVTTLSVNSPAGTESSAAHASKEHLLTFIRNTEGPQIHYMACTNADDLRLSDVKLLLQDYQRIGKMLNEMKKLAS